MDLTSLGALQQQSKKSFNDQKATIKKVLAGKRVNCKQCRDMLVFVSSNDEQRAKVSCKKGCTDIALDIG
ncbi:hypothetical protein ACFSJY_18525 [Thalassotalea euphylliae]|uniref:hypothetical protein n=1 Tax=Thalassotalea euphylliae TaxID=1655234 RepID=UPI00363853C5